jgi:hypothetical protein
MESNCLILRSHITLKLKEHYTLVMYSIFILASGQQMGKFFHKHSLNFSNKRFPAIHINLWIMKTFSPATVSLKMGKLLTHVHV